MWTEFCFEWRYFVNSSENIGNNNRLANVRNNCRKIGCSFDAKKVYLSIPGRSERTQDEVNERKILKAICYGPGCWYVISGGNGSMCFIVDILELNMCFIFQYSPGDVCILLLRRRNKTANVWNRSSCNQNRVRSIVSGAIDCPQYAVSF